MAMFKSLLRTTTITLLGVNPTAFAMKCGAKHVTEADTAILASVEASVKALKALEASVRARVKALKALGVRDRVKALKVLGEGHLDAYEAVGARVKALKAVEASVGASLGAMRDAVGVWAKCNDV